MARKHYRPEEIISKLLQVEVLQSQGMAVADAVRQIGVSEQTSYRWRKEYGGMKTDQLRRLKELEKENSHLRQAVSDLTLDELILKEASKGNFLALRVVANALITSDKRLAFLSAAPVLFSACIVRRSGRDRAAGLMRSA